MTEQQQRNIEDFYEYGVDYNGDVEFEWGGRVLFFTRYMRPSDGECVRVVRAGLDGEILWWSDGGENDTAQTLDEFKIDGVTLREMIPDCRLISMY